MLKISATKSSRGQEKKNFKEQVTELEISTQPLPKSTRLCHATDPIPTPTILQLTLNYLPTILPLTLNYLPTILPLTLNYLPTILPLTLYLPKPTLSLYLPNPNFSTDLVPTYPQFCHWLNIYIYIYIYIYHQYYHTPCTYLLPILTLTLYPPNMNITTDPILTLY